MAERVIEVRTLTDSRKRDNTMEESSTIAVGPNVSATATTSTSHIPAEGGDTEEKFFRNLRGTSDL